MTKNENSKKIKHLKKKNVAPAEEYITGFDYFRQNKIIEHLSTIAYFQSLTDSRLAGLSNSSNKKGIS